MCSDSTKIILTFIIYSGRLFSILQKPISKFGLKCCLILISVPLTVDIITMEIFVKHFIPASLNITNKFNPNLSDLSPLFSRWQMLLHDLMFSSRKGLQYTTAVWYAETFNFMALFILVEIVAVIVTRKIDYDATCWFVFIVLVFILLGLIGYLLLWTEFTNAKRGLFKLIPLVFAFGVNTRAIQYLSRRLHAWEAS